MGIDKSIAVRYVEDSIEYDMVVTEHYVEVEKIYL